MNAYLDQHPDIFMGEKELHFFGNDLKIKSRITEEEYLSKFINAGNAKIIGEASVWYLYSASAAAEIKAYSPDAKIIIMLREPVELMYSMHSQHLYDGNEDVADFSGAIG